MMTLTDFLLARIAEDETSASGVHGLECSMLAWGGMTSETCDCGWPEGIRDDCDAKRRIMYAHPRVGYENTRTGETDEYCEVCVGPRTPPHSYPCLTLRLLALPYAAYPDYRKEWKP